MKKKSHGRASNRFANELGKSGTTTSHSYWRGSKAVVAIALQGWDLLVLVWTVVVVVVVMVLDIDGRPEQRRCLWTCEVKGAMFVVMAAIPMRRRGRAMVKVL